MNQQFEQELMRSWQELSNLTLAPAQIVSTDLVGSRSAGVLDSQATVVA